MYSVRNSYITWTVSIPCLDEWIELWAAFYVVTEGVDADANTCVPCEAYEQANAPPRVPI